MKLLLEKGAELETRDNNNRAPLSYAAENGNEVVVKLLLEKCAELETRDIYSRTPLSSRLREFSLDYFASCHIIQNSFPYLTSHINSPICYWSGDRVGGQSRWLVVSRACSVTTP